MDVMERKTSGKRSIFISNLPAGTTVDQVRNLCEIYGDILDVRLHMYV
jgi:RNA recognition motif-containing protein